MAENIQVLCFFLCCFHPGKIGYFSLHNGKSEEDIVYV
ncbi:hypothetical protein BSBH6_03611 [Bacillus subtilis]|nr:hypothetical protein BSBH6_03611 [Bacillus subtilis]RPK22350.1 hypothetical protein BH5_03615 [Bacillus subtilis]